MLVRVKDRVVEYIYEDGVVLAGVEDVRLQRASSVEAMPTGIQFRIVWAPHIQPLVGEAETLQDEAGQPFTSHAAAVRHEVARLRRALLHR